MMRVLIAVGILFLLALAASGQDGDMVKGSPAYAEVLLRRTELFAEVESLAESYTDEAPKMVDLRFEVAALDKALAKLRGTKSADAGRLTLALGKLLVRRASLETDLNRLARTYNREHPDVKKTKKRLDLFDAAIKEILP